MAEPLPSTTSPESSKLPKLGPIAALALVAGSMLGAGIFIAPPQVAALVPNGWLNMAIWLLGGLTALCGAVSVAELGSVFMISGGDYIYVREAYGNGWAFSVGWLQILAIFPGSIATMAVAVATYQMPAIWGPSFSKSVLILGLSVPYPHLFAIILVLLFTLINQLRVKIPGGLQIVLTLLPIAFLTISAVVILFLPSAEANTSAFSLSPFEGFSLSAIAAAFLPVYFAYSGWNAAIYLAGEIKNPKRNLPLSLIAGTALISLLYILVCIGFITVLGMDGLADSGEAGTAVASSFFGLKGATVINILIFVAILGSINAAIMAGSRISVVMAKDGEFPINAATLHPVYQSPVFSLWVQAAIAVLLILTHSFENIINYATGAMLITGIMMVHASIQIRRKYPNRQRPFSVPWSPWPQWIYILSCVLVLVIMLFNRDFGVVHACFWFVGALTLHHILQKRNPTTPQPP